MANMVSKALEFGACDRGNVAMLFGLACVPLIVAGGVGLDFSRTVQTEAVIQEAADAALLRVSRLKADKASMTDAEIDAAARDIFDKATKNVAGLAVDAFDVVFDAASETFSLDIDANIPATLLGVAGVKSIDIDAHSEVSLGAPPYLEVVLALDNTGSMNKNNKIGNLRASASALVNSLFENGGAEVKIGLVPFAQYVNVGTSNAGAVWLGAEPAAWRGCVGSRAYPANTEDSDYLAQPVPAVDITDVDCPDAEILPLSTDKSAILAAINEMQGDGWTYIAEGVAWGRRVLSPAAPFTGGLSLSEVKKRGGLKALIVLTDGENTKAPTYPLHDSGDTASADVLTGRLCDETKKDGVVIYTIAFDVTDPGVRSLLETCSTTPSNYFEPDTAAQLSAVFAKIAANLRGLSLSK
jgi:Flp pilus assembly protein TadG